MRFQPSPLVTSLLDLDISHNSLQAIEALPPNARTQISFNKVPLRFVKGVLAKAWCCGMMEGVPKRNPWVLKTRT